jgi:hypothetical protein
VNDYVPKNGTIHWTERVAMRPHHSVYFQRLQRYRTLKCKKVAYFLDDLLPYKVSGSYASGVSIAPASQVSTPTMLVFLMVGNYQLSTKVLWPLLAWRYTKFHKNPSIHTNIKPFFLYEKWEVRYKGKRLWKELTIHRHLWLFTL